MIPNHYYYNQMTTPSTPSTTTPNTSLPSTVASSYTPRQAQYISFPNFNTGHNESMSYQPSHYHHHQHSHGQKLQQSQPAFLPDHRQAAPPPSTSLNYGFHLPPIKSMPVPTTQLQLSPLGSSINASNPRINPYISYPPVHTHSNPHTYKRSRGNSLIPPTTPSSQSSAPPYNYLPHSASSSTSISSSESSSSFYLNQNQLVFGGNLSPSTPLYRNHSTGDFTPSYYKFPNYPSPEEQVPSFAYHPLGHPHNSDHHYHRLSSKDLNSALPPQSIFIHHQKSRSLPSSKSFHSKNTTHKSSDMPKTTTTSYHMVNRFSSGNTCSTNTAKSGMTNIHFPSTPNKQFKYKSVGNIGNNANSQLRIAKQNYHLNHNHYDSGGFRNRSSNASISTIISKSSIHYPIHRLPIEQSRIMPVQKSIELRLQLYPSIEVKKYSTSAIDPIRNYLTVYEYHVNDHWVIWDYETGFVHLTGIWKAALVASNNNMSAHYGTTSSNLKADIVKLLESCPKEYHQFIKRIRGGFLKIQGTWLPFKLCRLLARRFCYFIRFELIPIFGIDFPDYCLTPNDRGFGELKLNELPLIDTSEFDLPVLPIIPHNSNLVIVGGTGEVGEPHKRIVPPTNVQNVQKRKKANVDPFSSAQRKENKKKLKANSFVKQEMMKGKETQGSMLGSFIPLPQPPSIKTGAMTSASSSASNTLLESPILLNTKKVDDRPIVASTNSLVKHVSPHHQNRHDLSYTEVMDIVNASKCLQSLSKLNPATQVSPIGANDTKSSFSSVDNDGKNYTTTSPGYNKSGISTILLAAGLSSETEALVRGGLEMNDLQSGMFADPDSSPTKHHRRASMKINDLLT